MRSISPLSSGGGGFWSAWYGKAPDVALNHPERWTVTLKVSDPGDGSCRPFNATSSDVDCVVLGARLPASLGQPDLAQLVSSDARLLHHGSERRAAAHDGDDRRSVAAASSSLQLEPGAIAVWCDRARALHGHAVEHECEHPRRPAASRSASKRLAEINYRHSAPMRQSRTGRWCRRRFPRAARAAAGRAATTRTWCSGWLCG